MVFSKIPFMLSLEDAKKTEMFGFLTRLFTVNHSESILCGELALFFID